MTTPSPDPATGSTIFSYALDPEEELIVWELMARAQVTSPEAVLDLALWKLAQWYGIDVPAEFFDLGMRARKLAGAAHTMRSQDDAPNS